MSTDSRSHPLNSLPCPQLGCRTCGQDDALEISSIDTVTGSSGVLADVTHRCTRCGSIRTQITAVTEVARILNRPGRSYADVLTIGGHYIHCGQPMPAVAAEVRTARNSSCEGNSRPLDVYLTTRVLRCPCGFQVEIPDEPEGVHPPSDPARRQYGPGR